MNKENIFQQTQNKPVWYPSLEILKYRQKVHQAMMEEIYRTVYEEANRNKYGTGELPYIKI